ncbi:ATP-binding protein [Streptomyces sp. NPDC059080]|uniref:ATP-binding protein n=1 Tax=Streptomyces sp. NPDC059080 TaxID=3346718 RepID=UPI00368C5D85
MADHQESTLTLPGAPESVATARRHVSAVLGAWGLDPAAPLTDAVRLIVSELATNAVRHTGDTSPYFTVALRLDRDETLTAGVTDRDPRPPRRLPAELCRDGGRGLLIVGLLAAESGGDVATVPDPGGGKTVRVRLPWPPAGR